MFNVILSFVRTATMTIANEKAKQSLHSIFAKGHTRLGYKLTSISICSESVRNAIGEQQRRRRPSDDNSNNSNKLKSNKNNKKKNSTM